MRTLTINDAKLKLRLRDCKKAHDVSHIVISGHPIDTLDPEELDLYRFMLGGLQAK